MQRISSWYHNWPIRRKLSAIVILVSGLLITFMAGAITIEKGYSYTSNLVKGSTVLAEIVGANSTAALAFRDEEAAHEILTALRAEQNLLAASLYDESGKVFTSYVNWQRRGSNTMPPMPDHIAIPLGQADVVFTEQYIDILHPISLEEKTVGYIALRTDLLGHKARMELFLAATIIFSLLLFFLGTLICARLNRTITGPVTLLADTMKEVMLTRNFGLRVKKKHDDEIGLLMDGFNSMLAQIEKRDRELAGQQERLETLVATRTKELKHANENLRREIIEREEVQARLAHAQRMEAIGTLAGGVAHDLNNILSGVVSYPDLLLLDMDKDAKLRKPIETIRTSGKKAAAIVQDLLTLARRAVKVAEPVELRGLIYDYLHSPEYRELQRHHPGVEVILPEYGRQFFTTGSPVHLSKTVMNLIANAAEAIAGKGKINIQLDVVQLDTRPAGFSQWRKGAYIRLTITDTGIGIAEKHLDRIFEPFYSRKVMGRSGTGLGMAVVWGTVEDHKGYITVNSREGEGTTFELFFPADNNVPLQLDQNPLPEEQLRGDGERVLVVDDSADQRQIACDILNYLGYSATAVASGEAAIEHLRHSPADLVLLDMLMAPGMDGLETYKHILALRPGQKAVIASGFSHLTHVEEARRLGVAEYVLKPYTVHLISQAMHRALRVTAEV